MRLRWKAVSPYSGKEIEEDAPANWAGGGNVHGIGVGPYGEPGIDPKKKKKRQQPKLVLSPGLSQLESHNDNPIEQVIKVGKKSELTPSFGRESHSTYYRN